MQGLTKLTAIANNIAAWDDWAAIEAQYPEIAKKYAPPEGAGWRVVDKAIAKVKTEVQSQGEYTMAMYSDSTQTICKCGAKATRTDKGECVVSADSRTGMSHSGVITIECERTSAHNIELEYFNEPYRQTWPD